MFYCGIDPGGNGGVALIDSNKKIWSLFKYDDLKFGELILEQYKDIDVKICIEDVHAIQGAKASSTFTFGFNVGKAHGISIASKNELSVVRPQEWKQEFGLIVDGGHEIESELKKQASIDKAHELFPDAEFKFKSEYKKDEKGFWLCNEFGKRKKFWVDHDGAAEALLIAEWRRRQDDSRTSS